MWSVEKPTAEACELSVHAFTVKASLWYQSIGYRWAHNLADYDTPETRRFVRMYSAMAPASPRILATSRATTR